MIGGMAAPLVLRRLRPKTVVTLCVWLWLPLIATVAVWSHAVLGLLAWGSVSFTGAVINVALGSHLADPSAVPDAMLGKVTGITSLVTQGPVPVGALSAGYIISAYGGHFAAKVVFMGIAILFPAVPLSLLITPSRLRTLRDRLKAGGDLASVAGMACRSCWAALCRMWKMPDERPDQPRTNNPLALIFYFRSAKAAPNQSVHG
jgi:hypothetical protein